MTHTHSYKKILVLGGNGFIGSHLIDALVDAGYYVRIFDRPNTTFMGHKNTEKIETCFGDICNDAEITEALEGIDVCFHLISTVLPKSSNLDPIFDIETNLSGTVKLLEHAVKTKLKKVIFLSSGGTIYGMPEQLPIHENHPTNPLCSYGITKLAIEKYLHLYYKLHGLEYTILRLANPFGERQRTNNTQGAVAVFLGKALRNETIEIWGDGTVVRDYIHIADVIRAMIQTLSYKGSDRIFNIGSGHGMSLNQILDNIETVLENKITKIYKPVRSFDVSSNILNINHAIDKLNWKPEISFINGLQRMAHWLKQE